MFAFSVHYFRVFTQKNNFLCFILRCFCLYCNYQFKYDVFEAKVREKLKKKIDFAVFFFGKISLVVFSVLVARSRLARFSGAVAVADAVAVAGAVEILTAKRGTSQGFIFLIQRI